jgi:hypothetical protein
MIALSTQTAKEVGVDNREMARLIGKNRQLNQVFASQIMFLT